MAVLVTGGAGYIGSHTVVELLDADREVVVVDNFYNSKPEALESIRTITGKDFAFYEADLCDKGSLQQIFKENDIQSVIHFAGLKAVGESVRLPLFYYHVNLQATFHLCEVMQEYGCRRIVFSSSATVYGNDNTPPFREDFPRSATNPYGTTKLVIEHMLEDICTADPEFSAVLLRYFNPIGAHESGLIGEDPQGIPNNLAPFVAKVAAGKLPEVSVFGGDYDTPDGTGVRDYLHVVDLAKGHLNALDYAMEHVGAVPINLGTGRGSSVLEVIRAFEEACGHPIAYKIVPRRAGDIATSYADVSRAREWLGWEARYDLKRMCEDMWRFAKTNMQ